MQKTILSFLLLLITGVSIAQSPIKTQAATSNSVSTAMYSTAAALIDGFIPGSPLHYRSAIVPTNTNTVWVKVDLGQPYPLSMIKLYWLGLDFTGNGTVSYTIATSADDVSYTTIYHNPAFSIASNNIDIFGKSNSSLNGLYRYVHLTFGTITPASVIRLRELECYAGQHKITYTYDAAGNRILRKPEIIVFPKKEIHELAEQTEPINKELLPLEETLASATVSIYPNPVSEELTIKFENLDMATATHIEVYDLNGRIVYNQETRDASQKIQVSQWKPGMYVLRMQLGKEVKEWKIVKE